MSNPTPDTITITISRGRWSVSRQMDLSALIAEVDAVSQRETLADLFDETLHGFILACQHLPDQFAPVAVEKAVPQPTLVRRPGKSKAPPPAPGKTLCQVFSEESQGQKPAFPAELPL